MKGLVGVGLLVVWPLFGASPVAVQTTVFLYESVATLVSTYASRRWSSHPRTNAVLHLCIGLGIALQIVTLLVPGLRSVLGLTSLSVPELLVLAVVIAATWVSAEIMGRVLGPGEGLKGGAGHRVSTVSAASGA